MSEEDKKDAEPALTLSAEMKRDRWDEAWVSMSVCSTQAMITFQASQNALAALKRVAEAEGYTADAERLRHALRRLNGKDGPRLVTPS